MGFVVRGGFLVAVGRRVLVFWCIPGYIYITGMCKGCFPGVPRDRGGDRWLTQLRRRMVNPYIVLECFASGFS